jgi:pimeloyl-ACP methyl ester carboxylesterase
MFRQRFTSMFVPQKTQEHLDWFNELQRRATSPDCAARYFQVTNDIDVSDLLSKVRTPTLVLHLREDAAIPFSQGHEIAAGILGARFVPLRGRNHMPLEQDPDTPGILEEIRLFLGA